MCRPYLRASSDSFGVHEGHSLTSLRLRFGSARASRSTVGQLPPLTQPYASFAAYGDLSSGRGTEKYFLFLPNRGLQRYALRPLNSA